MPTPDRTRPRRARRSTMRLASPGSFSPSSMARRRAGWSAASRRRTRCRWSASGWARASTICGPLSRAISPRRSLVSFSAVAKRYPGGQQALYDVSFSLQAGEIVFLTGRSGAGKSTLLKLIPAIERPTSGSVIVNGQNVGALKRSAIPYLRRNVGLVFQDQKLLYDRSVYDNVILPLAFSGQAPRDAARRARAALDKVGLLGRGRCNPIQLSGGAQQRIAIARAVVNRPGPLLADEPTANLGAESGARIIEIFVAFNQVGVTVLIATHDQALVERFGKRVLHLEGGRIR